MNIRIKVFLRLRLIGRTIENNLMNNFKYLLKKTILSDFPFVCVTCFEFLRNFTSQVKLVSLLITESVIQLKLLFNIIANNFIETLKRQTLASYKKTELLKR